MTIENGNTPHHQGNQSAEKNADGLTLQDDDTFYSEFGTSYGPEIKELVETMSPRTKREIRPIVEILLRKTPEEIARLKKLIEADDRRLGGDA
jgi:hypothetical protein